MMRQSVSRVLLSLFLALNASLGSGCAYWIELPASEAQQASATVATDARVPLLLETAHVTQNGSPIAPPASLERQVLGAIEATRLFSQYYQSGYAPLAADQAHVTVRLSIDTMEESHAGQAAWRGFVLGASMFVLAPFISLNYDYGTHMAIELERWDGQIKRYTAASNGSAHYNLFGASPLIIEQLKGQVTEACLSSLLNQVVQDSPFYLAGARQPPQRPLTVSVGVHPAPLQAISLFQPPANTLPP